MFLLPEENKCLVDFSFFYFFLIFFFLIESCCIVYRIAAACGLLRVRHMRVSVLKYVRSLTKVKRSRLSMFWYALGYRFRIENFNSNLIKISGYISNKFLKVRLSILEIFGSLSFWTSITDIPRGIIIDKLLLIFFYFLNNFWILSFFFARKITYYAIENSNFELNIETLRKLIFFRAAIYFFVN